MSHLDPWHSQDRTTQRHIRIDGPSFALKSFSSHSRTHHRQWCANLADMVLFGSSRRCAGFGRRRSAGVCLYSSELNEIAALKLRECNDTSTIAFIQQHKNEWLHKFACLYLTYYFSFYFIVNFERQTKIIYTLPIRYINI